MPFWSDCQVDVSRTYTFKHSKREWTGVPIMAANMYVRLMWQCGLKPDVARATLHEHTFSWWTEDRDEFMS